MAMAARGGAPAMAPQMGKRPSRGEGGTPPRERPPAAERTMPGGNGGPSQVGNRTAVGGAPKPAADDEKGNLTERAERQDEASRDSKARPPPRSAQQRRRPGAGVAPRRKVSLASPSTAPANKTETRPPPSSIRQPIRSAAQRQAAQRFSAPRAEPPAAVPRVPPPLIGSEDFYKHQQAGIKHARQAYNAKVNDHFDSLKRNNGDRSREEPPAPVDQIGSIAHERASRHVADIREFVAGER